jgi:hypothetical protein
MSLLLRRLKESSADLVGKEEEEEEMDSFPP